MVPSRLDAAKSAALEIIDGLRFRDEVAIVLAGSRPEVVAGMSGSTLTLRDAINAIPFSDSSTQLTAAIDQGRQMIGQHPHGQVVVLTDGAVDSKELLSARVSESPAEPLSAAVVAPSDSAARTTTPVQYRLFATAASNVGITQLQVRRSLIDPLGYEILASVRNASANPIACRLELSLNAIPVDVIPLKLKPEELWSRSMEKTTLEGGRLRGELTQIGRGAGQKRQSSIESESAFRNPLQCSVTDGLMAGRGWLELLCSSFHSFFRIGTDRATIRVA